MNKILLFSSIGRVLYILLMFPSCVKFHVIKEIWFDLFHIVPNIIYLLYFLLLWNPIVFATKLCIYAIIRKIEEEYIFLKQTRHDDNIFITALPTRTLREILKYNLYIYYRHTDTLAWNWEKGGKIRWEIVGVMANSGCNDDEKKPSKTSDEVKKKKK